MSSFSMIDRPRCVFTKAADLEHLHTFKDFPLFMGCSDEPAAKDLRADMSWWISRSSGSIQLNPLVPLDVLYDRPHNDAHGGVWAAHHSEFANFLLKFSPRKVFEIGGANAIIAGKVLDLDKRVEWTLLDPNPKVDPALSVRAIKGFLTADFKFDFDWDCMVHSHFLEHFYEPDDFLKMLSGMMKVGQKHVFSIPNMQLLLKNKYTNCINFEHTVFLSETFVDATLRANGFAILEKKHFADHSIFYATEKANAPEKSDVRFQSYVENRKLFEDFISFNTKIASDFNQKMANFDGPVFLFGAHIFSQFLIGFGLNCEKIVGVLDNSQMKIGKRLYGTPFKVSSPEVLRGLDKCAVVLRAANYSKEIKLDIQTNHNNNTIFWE